MAIYHLSASTASKATGQSAAAKADYLARAGEYGRDKPGERRDACLHVESANMPGWARDAAGRYAAQRSAAAHEYWRAADRGERANGRLFAQLEFALPLELNLQQQVDLARKFAGEVTTLPDGSRLPYTFALHAGQGSNPHVHLIVSERINDGIERGPESWFKRAAVAGKPAESGGAKKTTALQHKSWVLETRARWADAANLALAQAGADARIDHRSNADRGLADLPTAHQGWGAAAADRSLHNQRVREHNSVVARELQIDAEIAELQSEIDKENGYGFERTGRVGGVQRAGADAARAGERVRGIELSRVAARASGGAADRAAGARPGAAPGRARIASFDGVDFGGSRFVDSRFDGIDAGGFGAREPNIAGAPRLAAAAGFVSVPHMPGGILDGGQGRGQELLPGVQNDFVEQFGADRLDAVRRARASDRDAEQRRVEAIDRAEDLQRAAQPKTKEPGPEKAGYEPLLRIAKTGKAPNLTAAKFGDAAMRAASMDWARRGAEFAARIDAWIARGEAAKQARIDALASAELESAKDEKAERAAAMAAAIAAARAANAHNAKLAPPAQAAEPVVAPAPALAERTIKDLDDDEFRQLGAKLDGRAAAIKADQAKAAVLSAQVTPRPLRDIKAAAARLPEIAAELVTARAELKAARQAQEQGWKLWKQAAADARVAAAAELVKGLKTQHAQCVHLAKAPSVEAATARAAKLKADADLLAAQRAKYDAEAQERQRAAERERISRVAQGLRDADKGAGDQAGQRHINRQRPGL